MSRTIVCPCGHPMSATDDEVLFRVVRRHTDNLHSDLAYSDQDLRNLIAAEAYDS